MNTSTLIAAVRKTEAEFGQPQWNDNYVAFTRAAERYPDLSLAEERMLAAERDSNPAAKQALFACKMRKVSRVLHQFRNSGMMMDDLIQEGCIALHKAVETFDPNRNAAFNTYAVMLIRNGCYSLILSQRNETKIPKNSPAAKLLWKIHAIKRELGVEKLNFQQACDIATEFGMSVDDVACVERAVMRSIDIDDEREDRPIGDIMAADDDVEEEVFAKQEADRMLYAKEKVLDALSDRDRDIIAARFADEKETLSSIAKRLSISIQRVSEIEGRVLKQIKAAYEAAR